MAQKAVGCAQTHPPGAAKAPQERKQSMKSKQTSTLQICVSPETKTAIENAASAANLSTSAYIRTLLTKCPKPQITLPPAPMPTSPRTRSIRICVSDAELSQIRRNADTLPLSQYLRTLAINGPRPLIIEVTAIDITDFKNNVLTRLRLLDAQLAAMTMQTFITSEQYENLYTLLLEIRDEVRTLNKTIRDTRESIKKEALRELRKKIKYAIKEN